MELPHDTNAEEEILCCVMEDNSLAGELKADWFNDIRCRLIAETMLSLAERGKPCMAHDIFEEVKRVHGSDDHNIGLYISQMLAKCSPTPLFERWKEMLTGTAILRECLKVSRETFDATQHTGADHDEILTNLETKVMSIREKNTSCLTKYHDLKAAMKRAVSEWQENIQNPARRPISTGFNYLDRLICGFRPGQFIVIAARPGVGKTSLASAFIDNICIQNHVPTVFFSLEMSIDELVLRHLCYRSKVAQHKMRFNPATNTVGLSERDAAVMGEESKVIASSKLMIYDRCGLNMLEIGSMLRQCVLRDGARIAFIDYLGLISPVDRKKARHEYVAEISAGLKEMARKLQIPIVCLAQLNRESEKSERKPRMSDLRDSGCIEQDADILMLIHRDKAEPDCNPKAELIIAKARNEQTGIVKMEFIPQYTRFEELPYMDQGK